MKSVTKRRNSDLKTATFKKLKERIADPTDSVNRAIRDVINGPAPAFYIPLDIAEREINKLIASGKCDSGSMASSRSEARINDLLTLLKRNYGIRNGMVYRPRLAYILANCSAPTFYLSFKYARRLFYTA